MWGCGGPPGHHKAQPMHMHCLRTTRKATRESNTRATRDSGHTVVCLRGPRRRARNRSSREPHLGRLPAHVVDGVLVAEPVAALDGVVGVPAPVVGSHIAQGCVDTTLGCHRVRPRGKELGDAPAGVRNQVRGESVVATAELPGPPPSAPATPVVPRAIAASERREAGASSRAPDAPGATSPSCTQAAKQGLGDAACCQVSLRDP